MNASLSEIAIASGRGEKTLLLGVRIGLTDCPIVAKFFPPGNRIGTDLFQKLLCATLSARCLIVKSSYGLPLNQSVYFVEIGSGAETASAVAIKLLRDCGLDSVSAVAWYDDREGVWRTVHPNASVRFEVPSHDLIARETSFARSIVETVAQWFRGSGQRNPDNG